MLAQNPQNRRDNKSIVFVDTSAIAAVANGNDQDHNSALRIYKKLQELQFYFVVTNFVIAETHAILLQRVKNIEEARTWLVNSAYKDFGVFKPEKDMEMEAVKEIDKYKDKDFSLTDMLSFLVMEKIGIKYYFAYDKHFAQIGLFDDVSVFLNKS